MAGARQSFSSRLTTRGWAASTFSKSVVPERGNPTRKTWTAGSAARGRASGATFHWMGSAASNQAASRRARASAPSLPGASNQGALIRFSSALAAW